MYVDNSQAKHIKIWATELEPQALEQAHNLANLPFTHHHVALMPDAHLGYGMPIGGVLATKGVVIPNAVGVDIGCGMRVIETTLRKDELNLPAILSEIRERIPVGFKRHTNSKYANEFLALYDNHLDVKVVNDLVNTGRESLCSLGGGNHFIEIQEDDKGFIWVMIHSGSRNLGKQVCDYYNKVAENLNKKWYSNYTKDLAFLPFGAVEYTNYLADMNFCVKYAKLNRELMMAEVTNIIDPKMVHICGEADVAHNYVRLENHYGANVMVHRKGATSAKLGELGIIPGSQGTNSYIVEGLGNPESFMSCSHGAGRKMGRKFAINNLDLEHEKTKMKGILGTVRTINDLDEAPGAYKDIDTVMENQKDLVEIITKLSPLAVVKG